MRKWIFGLLLLGNVVFFALMQWGSALTVDADNPPTQGALNADKIKIVNMSAFLASTSVLPVASAVVAASAPVAVPKAESAVAVVAKTPPPAPLMPKVEASAPAATKATPPPPVAAKVIPAAPVIAKAEVPAKLLCMEWGEFSGTDLSRADIALATMKLGDRLKSRTVEYTSGYWVYIAPMKTHEQIKQKAALLKKLAIEDYFVVQETGPWKNAISLGVFKSAEAAKKYLLKLHKRGLTSAKMGARAVKLKFTVFVLNRLDSAASSQLAVLHKDFPDSEIRQIPCVDAR